MEEKRQAVRIRRPLIIKAKNIDGIFRVFSLSNISEKGVCFISPTSFPAGETIDVALKLPVHPTEWHECRCMVLESKDITKFPGAFVSGFRTRLRFDFLPELTAGYLKDYCDFAIKQNLKLNVCY